MKKYVYVVESPRLAAQPPLRFANDEPFAAAALRKFFPDSPPDYAARPLRVVWFSRHEIMPLQREELRRLFGENVVVIVDTRPFDSAGVVVERFRAAGGDEMAIVAPLSVIEKICQQGIQPLRAGMERIDPPARIEPGLAECGIVEAAGRWYRFVEFRRITRLELVTETVTPLTE